MDYRKIFYKAEHKIVEVFRDGHFPPIQKEFFSNRQVERILRDQRNNTDLFINKYAKSGNVRYIILDIDSKKLSEAKKDTIAIKSFIEDKGHSTATVFSTNKGYHLYIAINPLKFTNNELFKLFVEEFINMYDGEGNLNYPNLDPTNTNAGLKGNIRLIGSVHPVTKKKVEIVEGSFIDYQDLTVWQKEALNNARIRLINSGVEARQRKLNKVSFNYNGSGSSDYQELIDNNDLREIIPAVYNIDLKDYNGYSMGICPKHNDNHRSLMITKDWFKCLACGWKGNVNNLIAMGELKKEDIN